MNKKDSSEISTQLLIAYYETNISKEGYTTRVGYLRALRQSTHDYESQGIKLKKETLDKVSKLEKELNDYHETHKGDNHH